MADELVLGLGLLFIAASAFEYWASSAEMMPFTFLQAIDSKYPLERIYLAIGLVCLVLCIL